MEDYGDDVGAPVRVHPPSVDFVDVERGIKYVIKVAVKNVSHRQERVRFIAPPTLSGFNLHKLETLTIAPGMEATTEVEFVLAADEDSHSTLKVDVSGKVVEIPMHAYRPRAELVVESVLNFGPVVHENVPFRTLRIANRGKRAGHFAFDVSMIDGSAGATPLAASRDRSVFTIVPDASSLQPGEEKELRVELDARSLGPARGLAHLTVTGGIGPSLVDLSANVLMQRVEMLDPKGVLMPKHLHFGQLFAGLDRQQTCTLINNGPSLVSFSFATLHDDDEPQELAEDEELDREASDAVFSVSPVDGQIAPFESIKVAFKFAPLANPPTKAGFRTARAELRSRPPPKFAVCKRLTVLETEQQLDVVLHGFAVTPSVSLSRSTIQFTQPCKLHDHQDATVTITNSNLEMPVDFAIDKAAHFAVAPSAGRLAPGASRELLVTFAPRQQGAMQKVLTVSIFKGAVLLLPLHVSGVCQGTNGRRAMIGGPLALPEDFVRQPTFALTTARPIDGGITTLALRQPVGDLAATGRKPIWQQSEELDETIANGLAGLAKRKTFGEQMSLQKALDRREMQHTGFELSARELAQLGAHKERYVGYLRQSHADRTAKAQGQFVKPTAHDEAAFELGVDLGMASLTARGAHPLEGGWSSVEPRIPLPRAKDSLWLEHAYDVEGRTADGAGKGSRSRALLFDDRKLIKRKHKPVPMTAEEIAQCNMSLLPKDLVLVSGGPKVINFGTISIHTLVHRSFNVANDLLSHVLVEVEASEEPELSRSSPASQVLPPNGIAGFDLLFSSAEIGPFRKVVSYTINERYSFKFTVAAEVVPIDVELSTDELKFAFAENDLAPNITLPVTLTNRGTFRADFESRGPAVLAKRPVAFVVEPEKGTVEAGKSKEVLLTFTPTPGAVNEHVLTFVIEGGPSRTLLCRAEVEEARCSVEPKRLDFGLLSVGIPKELTLTVKNHGAEMTVIYWDQPPEGLELVPPLTQLAANSSAEVSVVLFARAPLRLDAPLSAHVRGGKPCKVHVTADAQLPQVGIVEDEFAFGTVTVGATATRTLTLVNSGQLVAALDLMLTNCPGFDISYKPPARVGAAAEEGGEEDAEVPVQLLSVAEDSGAELAAGRRKGPSASRAGDEEDELEGGANGGAADDRDYRIAVPAGGSLQLTLSFVPSEPGSHDFELPVLLAGIAVSPSLRRAVSAHAIAARIVLLPRHLDLGACIVRDAEFPYEAEVALRSVDPERVALAWEIDTSSLAGGGLIELWPTSGRLGADESATIRVRFCPTSPCAFERLSLPVYLDGEKGKAYVTLELSARGVKPRLTFDRSEVVLPSVPLGFVSSATFLVLNDGYENLEIAHKLPADSAKVPLTLSFPEGNMVGLGRQALPVVLSFSSRKPMSFTAKVFMIDTDGRKFGVTVSGTTDNSVLTVQDFLHEHRARLDWLDSPGKPVMLQLKETSDSSFTKANQKRKMSLAKRRASKDASAPAGAAAAAAAANAQADGGQAPPPPIRPEWPAGAALARAIAEAEAEAEVLQPWIKSFLLDLPTQRPFPGGLIAARGRPLLDVLEAVSGKPVSQHVPREVQSLIARPPKSRVALARALCRQYEVALTFLKQHGALLGSLRPEELLSRDDFVRWHAAQRRAAAAAAAAAASRPPPTRASAVTASGGEDAAAAEHDGRALPGKLSSAERRELLSRHRLASLRAWSAVFYQTIKVFVVARVTARALRTTPGVSELVGKGEELDAALAGSNVYSQAEGVLLHWATLLWRKVAPEKAVGALARVSNLEQLCDGHVLAALLLAHAPFLASAPAADAGAADDADAADGADSASAEPGAGGKQPKPGSSISCLFPAPCTPEQAERNVSLCVQAMSSQLAIERPPSVQTFVRGTERDLLLTLLGLYQTLPHYVPKTTIEFAGALHEAISKSIELTNPAKRPIQYVVRLEGSTAFELPLGRVVRIEPRSTLAFPVIFASRFAADAKARLLFLSRGDGVTTAHATSLSFVLDARITSKKPHATLVVTSPLYAAAEREVTVTNPFAEPCTFTIGLSETRPPVDLDGSALAGGAGAPASGQPARGARPAAAVDVRAAARDAVRSIPAPAPVSRAAELEGGLARLPAAFHVVSADPRKPETTLVLAAGASTSIRLQFMPFILGEHVCELSFLDARRGEFVYVVRGTGTLPAPTDTIAFRCDANSSVSLPVQLPYRNEQLEKARADALRRLAKVRDKDLERSREPLRKSPLHFKLEFSGTFFGGPDSIELQQAEGAGKLRKRGISVAGNGPSAPTTAAGSKLNTVPGTPAEFAAEGEGADEARRRAKALDGSSANTVSLQFLPRQAGTYSSKLVLYSHLDVRVFNLVGSAPTPGTRATLQFTAPARRAIKQELPIVNATSMAWDLSVTLTGTYFRGPSSLRVGAGQTEKYVLEFAPEWICQSAGELVLLNLTTGDRFAYALSGTGEEPLAEGTVVIDVVARSRATSEFAVFNVSADGREVECSVESDLMHVSGEPTVLVPARSGPLPFGKQVWASAPAAGASFSRRVSANPGPERRGSKAAPRPPPASYVLAITPQLGGAVHGSVTIKAPDGRYLWYTVEVRASPPPAEKTIEVTAAVRTAVALEVEVVNPSHEAVEFKVELEGEGLLGAPTLLIGPGPNSVAKYELVFSPLLARVSSGAVSFLNASVGEFWYKLLLTATQQPPEVLPLLEVELCKSASHVVRVDNPLAQPIQLRALSSNPRNWTVGTRNGESLSLPPFGTAEVVLQYSPSVLGLEQPASIQLTHPMLADWSYSVRGVGLPPTTMAATEVSAELHSITSVSVSFQNPLDQAVAVSISLEMASSPRPVFALLMRRTQGVTVAPGAKLQVPFTFEALAMHEHDATIVIATDAPQHGSRDRLTWRFPIVAYAESLPRIKPLVLAVRARQQLQTMLELPLNGLGEAASAAAFSVELQAVPEEHQRMVAASLRLQVAGPLADGALLPVAVQWTPLKPLKAHASLVVRQANGGRWKYDVTLNAFAPEVDDVILIESTLNRTASVSFSLANAFNIDAEFTASFSAESPMVFTVRPPRGVLPRAGSSGQQLVVSFTPVEYGKPAIGMLIITTAEMQWSYEVRGQPPVFTLPEAKKKIDDQIDPAIERRLQQDKAISQSKNFMRRNMQL